MDTVLVAGEDARAHGLGPTMRRFAQAVLRPGDVVIDIGAADGAYALGYAGLVGPYGVVLAVEPHPITYDMLQWRCHNVPQIRAVQFLVGAHEDLGTLYEDSERHKRSSLWPTNVVIPGNSYAVPMTTVDALVATLPTSPRLIKIDAQGAEAHILVGAAQTLALPVSWVLELWRDGLTNAGATVAEVLEPFRREGYLAYTKPFVERCRLPMTYSAIRRRAERLEGHRSMDVLFTREPL